MNIIPRTRTAKFVAVLMTCAAIALGGIGAGKFIAWRRVLPCVHSTADPELRFYCYLTPWGQEAFDTLINTGGFFPGLVGYGADLMAETHSYNLLLTESRAADAFAYMAEHGSPAGKVWGLCGLYATERKEFIIQAARLCNSEEAVFMMSGCSPEIHPLGEMIVSRENRQGRTADCEALVREVVASGETQTNRRATQWDIASGAYAVIRGGPSRALPDRPLSQPVSREAGEERIEELRAMDEGRYMEYRQEREARRAAGQYTEQGS